MVLLSYEYVPVFSIIETIFLFYYVALIDKNEKYHVKKLSGILLVVFSPTKRSEQHSEYFALKNATLFRIILIVTSRIMVKHTSIFDGSFIFYLNSTLLILHAKPEYIKFPKSCKEVRVAEY
jgi:hypothetical protein